ncbi:MAG: N-6 DNA methylase [Bacteroides sp.]|nr:N-6 DNA methylase [Roseburia sp.]MCM1347526.1 N-6 DNA methylase [Bacteroides sp.]MCM1421996.1 N-6 DNA methylase [Bacteroides sp.]
MAEKNRYGQYFTIGLIADFMVSLITHSKDSKVLEPSCGKGVFLDCLVNGGYTNISAYEIDTTLGAKYNFIKFASFLSVPTSDKYNVVIGNPPYIRWKNIEPELKQELENNLLWNRYFNSLCDYLFIFILKSIEHLEENGELIFICTEYWMNTTHSATLRNYMCANGYFTEIYQFKETPLFEKVTASFVIFRFVKSKQKKSTIKLYNYNKNKELPTKKELDTRSCFYEETIPHFKENGRWILASQKMQDKLNKFENGCLKISSSLFDRELHKIGDYCDIGNGMVSGLDAAFQISETSVLNADETKALIDVFKAKDLGVYKNKSVTKYVFIQEGISVEDFEKKYPHFATHFEPNIEKLNARYSYNRNIPYWEFVFPRNQKLFERDEARIFVPCKERISNKNYFRFCYASSRVYPTQDVTAIFRKRNCKESLEYILAYLNNDRVFNWLGLNGIVKGAIVEFSEAPIASIPFRPIDWENPNEVSVHDEITKEVQEYIKDEIQEHIENIHILFNKLFHE